MAISMIIQYFYNFFLLSSQALSVFLGGHPDRSVSQRTAEAYLAHVYTGTLKEKWFTKQMAAIDYLFWNGLWKTEQNHCLNSLKGEPNAKEIWDWSK